MRGKVWTGLATICLVAAMLGATGANANDSNKNFVVSGANAVADIARDLVSSYQARYSGWKGAVNSSSTAQGLQDLLDGQADVAMATRDMTDKEKQQFADKGVSVSKTFVGYIGLAIVTRADNPLDVLTMKQLKEIFLGKVRNWKEIGGPDEAIDVIIREAPKRGSAVLFQQTVLNGEPHSKESRIAERWNTIVTHCAKQMAIGYMPTIHEAVVQPKSFGIKILQVQAADGTTVAPLDSSYPIKIPFFLFWNVNNSKPAAKEFCQLAKDEVRLDKVQGVTAIAKLEAQPK
jgi:phosphate transport system substrate-binding protein